MTPESSRLPYTVLVNIARLVSERRTLGVAAIPSIAEEVRVKYPMIEITDRDLEQVISEFLEAPQI